ncbi:flagellin [Roseibium sediminis]|uniref:flagellin N-terminal helical domain-containing protein n=1 Tax=Roseibium sediminis TaxID=1775174 RepID=UPI00123CBE87|nr:flagellin [Roseibium sediminis]
MSGITITSAVRSNLNALQSTAEMMSSVQNKLSTGKKVNSALDNPNSFFTAKALENRASDLATLLDDQSQSIQTIKAADKGINAISELVDAAKAKANQALQSSSKSERLKYSKEYNELMTQIEDIAKDSGYKGKNLLAGSPTNDLKVVFNEDGSSNLDIKAVDYTDTTKTDGLNLSDLADADGIATGKDIILKKGTTDLTATAKVSDADGFAVGDVLTLTDSKGAEKSIKITDTMTLNDLATGLGSLSGDTTATAAVGKITIKNEKAALDFSGGGQSVSTGTWGGFGEDSAIEETLGKLKSAQDTLRAQASTFGTNLSIVQNRESFTKAMINTLEEGAGKLTLADTNAEGANLLALQTQQQLASTSLSLASQASQNVLRLIG